MVPLLFMGEEWGCRQPFLFFTDYRDELALAVREGRRNEFSECSQFADPQTRQQIPDPNAHATFVRSQLDLTSLQGPRQQEWLAFYKDLLALRRERILPGLETAFSLGAQVLGEGAVLASWQIGQNTILRIAVNLGNDSVSLASVSPSAERLYTHRVNADEFRKGLLPSASARVTLEDMP